MDARTGMFLLLMAFSLGCCALGYAARKRGWAPERWSRPLHLHTIVWLWSPVTLVSFWNLPLGAGGTRDLLMLMAAQPLLMVAAATVMWAVVKRAGWPRLQQGVMILAAALSNHGFPLGAYLCYALLEPGETALSYGIAFVTSMQVFMVLIFYPVAHHFGDEDSGSTRKLIVGSFITVRAMPLYAAVAGLVLNIAGATVPKWIFDYHLLEVFFFAGNAGAFGGVGLRLRLGDSLGARRMHGLLAIIQFGIHPLVTAGVITLLMWAGIGPSGLVRDVMMIEAFTPTALNLVIVSNLFHLDARLGSVLWLWNTMFFLALPLPLLIAWY